MKKLTTCLLLLTFSLMGCGKSASDPAPAADPTITAEIDFCSTTTVYASPVVVTGTARFFKRDLRVVPGVSATIELKGSTTTPLPIKFAEIRVLNSAGTVVQCGKTNSAGALKALDGSSDLNIPNTAGAYTIEVLPRSNHIMTVGGGKPSFVFYVSVKKDYYSNEVYKLFSSITNTGSGTISTTLTAYALESQSTEVLGGAFNIYNSLLSTYEYLADTANTGTSNLSCLNPKFDVYWKAGFNPAQYLYPSENPATLSGVSFYLRGEDQLFIMGGKLGSVSEATTDTDHFDDTVIIHELAHRIEDTCGKSDSPGLQHYGRYREDPRLAWSEGWANFFGAHIVKAKLSSIQPDVTPIELPGSGWPYYYDTVSYDEGGSINDFFYFALNLTKAGNNPDDNGFDDYYDRVDSALYPGEGHFRELSIARALFKGTNTCAALCSNTNYFSYYWQATENSSSGIGMGKSSYAFRSSPLFYDRLDEAFGGPGLPAGITSILNSDEAQQPLGSSSYESGGQLFWPAYGIKLVSSGSPCSPALRIQPRPNSAILTDDQIDQRYSNHFFRFDRATFPTVTSITLNASRVSGSTLDLDILGLIESYKLPEDTCASTNASGDCTSHTKILSSTSILLANRTNAPGASIAKTLTGFNSLTANQTILLNIRAFLSPLSSISTSTEYTYTLTDQSGAYLCPSTTF